MKKIFLLFLSLTSLSSFADICSDYRPLEKESYLEFERELLASSQKGIGEEILRKEIELARKNEELMEANIQQLCDLGLEGYNYMNLFNPNFKGDVGLSADNRRIYQELRVNSLRVANAKTCGLLDKTDKKIYRKIRGRTKKVFNQLRKLIDAKIKSLSKDEKELLFFQGAQLSQLSREMNLNPLNYNLKKKVLNTLTVMGNLTWGIPNTVVGGLYTLAALGAAPFLDGIKIGKSDNGKQIRVETEFLPFFVGGVSMGLFQFDRMGGDIDAHEGGHAVQSAILGPLYFPTIGATYALSGVVANWAEDNADHNGDILPSRAFKKKECQGKSDRELMSVLERP